MGSPLSQKKRVQICGATALQSASHRDLDLPDPGKNKMPILRTIYGSEIKPTFS